MSTDSGQNAATSNPTSKSDVASEIAWLIELPQHARQGQPPTYWGYEEGSQGWTCDINAAIRFKARDEADMCGSDCGILDYEVVEHAWASSVSRPAKGDAA